MRQVSLFLLLLILIQISSKEEPKIVGDLKKPIILAEEDKNDSEKTENEEDQPKIDISTISPENLPRAEILLPIRRPGTSKAEVGKGPCGGVTKTLANTLTTKGAVINVIWEVSRPEFAGNCMVSISAGLQEDKNFQVLKPIDGESNSDGSFSCGREKGFEHREFRLPPDYECDGCTLQWKWKTPYGNFYSCSDIIINGGSLSNCMGRCMNGGSCFNGNCICPEGTSGDYCEDSSESSSKTWLWVLLGLAGAGGVGYGGYWAVKKLMDKKSSDNWTRPRDKNDPSGVYPFSGTERNRSQVVDPSLIKNESQFPAE